MSESLERAGFFEVRFDGAPVHISIGGWTEGWCLTILSYAEFFYSWSVFDRLALWRSDPRAPFSFQTWREKDPEGNDVALIVAPLPGSAFFGPYLDGWLSGGQIPWDDLDRILARIAEAQPPDRPATG